MTKEVINILICWDCGFSFLFVPNYFSTVIFQIKLIKILFGPEKSGKLIKSSKL